MSPLMKTYLAVFSFSIFWLEQGVAQVFFVREDAQSGSQVGTIQCHTASNSTPTLLDQNGTPLNNNWFELRQNTSTSWNILAGKNFHTINNSSVVLKYRCPAETYTTSVTVDLQAVNKHPPFFCLGTRSPVVITIPEDTEVNTDIHNFTICDGDRRVTFDIQSITVIQSITPPEHFRLIKQGDVLKLLLNKPFDYDTMGTHILNYTITIGDSALNSTALSIQVNITDVDDLSPAFSKELYKCQIQEGQYKSQATVCSVRAVDQDSGLSTPLNYTIISAVPSTNIFTVNSKGEIKASGVLDRENISSYSLVIKGFQQDSPSHRYNFTTVIVKVTDIDDNPPKMSTVIYNKYIMENTENGVEVLQVTASDPDEGDNGKFSFLLHDPHDAFTINSSTGVISVKNSMLLDYEDVKAKHFLMYVYAVPHNHPDQRDVYCQVNISLIDVNDNDPVFQDQPYTFNISKNTSDAAMIGQITAKDPDTGTNLSYYLVSQTDTIPFTLYSQTGSLTIRGNLYENYKPVYNLTVIVADGPHSLPTTRRSSALVTVLVKDVNMFQPVFAKGINGHVLNISEDTSIGAYLLELSATDKDSRDTLRYSIIGGHSKAKFELQDRILYVKQHLDREVTPAHYLTVQVSDGPHSATATITINIVDENDNAPVFQNMPYVFNVTEEQPSTTIGHVTATDADTGLNSVIHYTLADGYLSGNFTINNSTGEIITTGRIDRESLLIPSDIIELVVVATDGGSPPRSNSTKVSVTVIDINDNMPVLKESIVNISLPEEFRPGVIYHIQASDPDSGINAEIKYLPLTHVPNSLVNYTVFTDGTVRTLKPLQIKDDNNQFSVIVIIKNPVPYSTGKHRLLQKIYLTVDDVNNCDPEFDAAAINKSLREDYPTGKTFERMKAKDDDFAVEFKTITYWIHPEDVPFGIDSHSGELYVARELDYENQTKYTFQVYASDMHNSSNTNVVNNVSIPVTVNVEDVNDNPPKFKQGFYNCSVYENFQGMLTGCKVEATDEDKSSANSHIVYSISNNKDFSISLTGEISVRNKLDYENGSVSHKFDLQIVAIDNGFPPLSALATVTVHLLNENDNIPQFNSSVYHFDAKENNSVPVLLGQILATDADGDRLIYGCDNTDFSFIDGTLKISSALDYETNPFINFTITASDKKNTTAAYVSVRILPVNEFSPVIHLNTGFMYVTENQNVTFTLKVTDDDHGEDGRISLDVGVADEWKSHITCSKDIVKSLASCKILELDREKVESIGVLLIARDYGSPPRSDVVTKTIKIRGVNDNAPYFLVPELNITLTEGVATEKFYTAQAVDGDQGIGSTVVYRLKDGNSTLFDVAQNGTVSIKALWIDNDNMGTYSFTVEAYNHEPLQNCTPSHLCVNGVQKVTIHLQDINNHWPKFATSVNQHSRVAVSECLPTGSNITRVVATDDDTSPEFNTVTYWLQDHYNNTFRIDTYTGDVYLVSPLDYDAPASQRNFSLAVYATDLKTRNANNKHTTSTRIEIVVEDCNDNPPKFDKADYRCATKENSTGEFNCTVRATDVEENSKIIYKIVNETASSFAINETTGILRVKQHQELDYERSAHQFRVTVMATDNGTTPLESHCTVVIKVLNINDMSPEFLNTPYKFSLYENTEPNSSSIGDISVRDEDGDSVTVTIQGDNTGFWISNNHELIPLRSFDYENLTNPTVVITLVANDTVHTSTARVTVNILDRNDMAPKFVKNVYNETVKENVTVGHQVVQVSASDYDSPQDGNNHVTYTIMDGAGGKFQINSTSGWISTASSLNASVRDSYTLIVQASDHGTPRLVNITMVTIHVEDINDLAPWFLHTPYSVSVKENENASLLQVYGMDPDPSTTQLKFDVVQMSHLQQKFWFDGNTLHVAELDAETTGPAVYVDISLNDEVHTVYTKVKVTVTDVNDNKPDFNISHYDRAVDDTAKRGMSVLNVTAFDKDITNENLTYILYGGMGDFTIDRSTGLIKVSDHANLDYKRISIYNMTVLVQDSGSPPKTNTAQVKIWLNETNIHPPIFSNSTYNFKFPENNPSVSDKVQAVDTDINDKVTYSIITRDDNNLFTLDNHTGMISLAHGSLDYEVRNEYSFTIEAKDDAAFPKSSTATVTITVEDVNEAPKIIINPKNAFKEINSTGEVIIVTANDTDIKPEFKNFTYSLKGDRSNVFKIDPESGQITVRQRLNEARNFSLNVSVTDGGGLTDSGLLFVIVSNITGISLNTSVYENQTTGSFVYDLHQAAVNLSGLVLQIQREEYSNNFRMEKNNTVVSTTVLDRETAPVFGYDLIINGKDTVNNIMKAQIQLHVTVLDVNDNPPSFSKSKYALSVNEEMGVGTHVGIITAMDKDQNPVLTYSIVNSSDYFNINDSGVITVKKRVDREAMESSWNGVLKIHVECSDGNYTAITEVDITIIDINDNKPEFTIRFYSLALYENYTLGVISEVKIAAKDIDTVDQGKLNYSIIDGNIGDHFFLDLSTGNLDLVKSLDYENRTEFNLTIRVKDGIYNDTAIVHVTVLDVNDNAPKFSQPSYMFTTPEGISSFHRKFNVTATDIDSGNNSLLTYSFLKDDHSNMMSEFKISSSSSKQGVIEVVSELDRDNNYLPHKNGTGSAYYTFTVVAMDSGVPQLSGSTKVTVYVTDINDCPPKFTVTNYTLDVQEGSPPGHHLMTVSTSDCDYYSNYTTVFYSLLGEGAEHFNISKIGEITLRKPISIQDRSSFDLVVSATDTLNTANASLRINILDTNDHPPVFNKSSYSFKVSENARKGVVVGYVSAVDEDPGDNGRVTYNLTSGDGKGLFDIVSDNGTILLLGHLDRELQDSYTLFITATDHAKVKAERRSGNCEVKISVADENDNSPKFLPLDFYSASIKEDAGNGTILNVIPKINATDDDNGENGTSGIRYSLSGDGSHTFCIDPLGAVIRVCQENLDRETVPSYQLQIIATDRNGSADGKRTKAVLNITVMDVNDNVPQFVENYKFSVYENTNTTTSVGQVDVTDDDLPNSNKIRYSIRSGGMGQFYIDPVTGSIHVSGSLDREKADIYHLNVTVTDGKQDHINWTIVTVNILDVNDNAPQFNNSVVYVRVYEGLRPMNILKDSAFDVDEKDTNNSRISFYLKRDTETDSLFNITDDGILSTLQPLDRETRPSYTLTVIAIDHGDPQLSSSQTVRVVILDVNDNYPLFCMESNCTADFKEAQSYIVEKSPTGSVVALLVAKDIDEGNNASLMYSIKGDEKQTQFFTINRNTGLVTLKQSVDINRLVDLHIISENETDNAAIEVTVVATDQGTPNPLSTNLTLIVSVEGINDDAPVFKKPLFSFNVSEDLKIETRIGEAEAIVNSSDPHLSYSKVSDIGSEKFVIDGKTGIIKLLKPLDREKESYFTFPIYVRDGGYPERTAFAAVEINVQDVNDNSPEFLQDKYDFDIPENITWTGVMNISAMDKDEGKNAELVYQLVNDFGGLLSIDNQSGVVTLSGVLDREVNSTVVFTVLVKDNGTPSHNSYTSVTIHVLDLNDNAPTFINTPDTVNMTENDVHQNFQVYAKDPDEGLNGTVIFEISGLYPGPFQINPFNGKVTLLDPLDYELVPQYNLTILASDQGIPFQQASHNVMVNVVDVYDFIPSCHPEVIETNIKSSVAGSTEIAQVNAGMGNLRYSLTGGPSEFFMVDKLDGKIYTNHQLGRETKQYILLVTAIDQNNHRNATCKVIVHIQGTSASFPLPSYNASISENLNVTVGPTLLIDLNSTEEIRGDHVTYTISGRDPRVTSKFLVDSTSGKVYCNTSLDRETQGVYELYITAHTEQARRKRDTSESTELETVKVTVVVLDVNDNPPKFTDAQRQNQLFGVPSTAKANYPVTTLKTFDPDQDSKTLYKVIDGDMTLFGVDSEKGEIRTLAAIAKSKKKLFDLTVMAIDQSEPSLNDTISLKIFVVDPSEQLVLTANMSVTDFIKKSEYLISTMGEILGVTVQLEYSMPHKQSDGSVDLRKTDIFFHGLNKTTNTVIPYDIMLELMKRNEGRLKELFNMQLLEVEKVPADHYLDPSKITMSQIALICMAVFIFFGSFLGVVLTLYSWQRLEELEESEAKTMEKSRNLEIELESLRSRHSNRPDVAAAFINQGYAETEFSTSSLTNRKKKDVQYESQEMRMTFEEEFPRGMVLHNGPVHRDGNGSYSVAESGVENVSLHSSDQTRAGSSTGQTESRSTNGDGTGNRDDNTGVAKEDNEDGKAKNDQISEPMSVTLTPVLTFLNVNESPVMTSSPRESHTDVKSTGTPAIVFDEDHSSSETESTTDVLDVDKTTQYTNNLEHISINVQERDKEVKHPDKTKEGTTRKMTTIVKDTDKKGEQLDFRGGQGNTKTPEERSRSSSVEDIDQLERERTITLSFEEIGETNDEAETTQF